jgi:phenylpyruvate tautomerase PptA (4-oxalocrotonate tautomerase family)
MKTLKEKEMLIKWARLLGEEVDPELIASVEKEKRLQKQLEVMKERLEEPKPVPDVQIEPEPIIEPVIEDQIQEQAIEQENSIVDQVTQYIHENTSRKNKQTNVLNEEVPDRKYQELNDKIERLYKRILAMSLGGGGGGEVNLLNLDDFNRGSIGNGRVLRYSSDRYPKTFYMGFENAKEITGNTYTTTVNDYYIGVNHDGQVNITLMSNPEEGRQVVIKDELGKASWAHKYIDIFPAAGDLIDNHDKARIAIDYGSLTLIYRNGWRII